MSFPDADLYDAARRDFTLANARPVAVRTLGVMLDRLGWEWQNGRMAEWETSWIADWRWPMADC
jgi:hypothetical protein